MAISESELSPFDKFLRGIPLTDELRAIREGRENTLDSPLERIQEQIQRLTRLDDATRERPILREDRAELRDWRNRDGWGIFLMLQRKAIRIHVEKAVRDSESGYLTPEKLAEQWANVRIFKRACQEMLALVEAEIEELEKAEKA